MHASMLVRVASTASMHRMHECWIEAALCKRVRRMGEMLAVTVKAGVAAFRCAACLAADQHDKHCEAASTTVFRPHD